MEAEIYANELKIVLDGLGDMRIFLDMTLPEQLISVCADSPAKLRACDSERLFDMALEENCINEVKNILIKRGNPDALRTYKEAESDYFTSKYQGELMD